MKKYLCLFSLLLAVLFSVPCGAEDVSAAEIESGYTETSGEDLEASSQETDTASELVEETDTAFTSDTEEESTDAPYETDTASELVEETDTAFTSDTEEESTDAPYETESMAENGALEEPIVTPEDAGGAPWSLSTWFRETVMPLVIAYAIPALLFLAETIPMLMKVKRASGRFDETAANVSNVLSATESYKEVIEAEKLRFEEEIREALVASEERAREYEAQLLAKEEALQETVEKMVTLAEEYKDALAASEKRLATELYHIEKSSDKTERMVYLGMTNSGELVQNGAARKIAKVEESDDEG